jgi:hypothetical protein
MSAKSEASPAQEQARSAAPRRRKNHLILLRRPLPSGLELLGIERRKTLDRCGLGGCSSNAFDRRRCPKQRMSGSTRRFIYLFFLSSAGRCWGERRKKKVRKKKSQDLGASSENEK